MLAFTVCMYYFCAGIRVSNSIATMSMNWRMNHDYVVIESIVQKFLQKYILGTMIARSHWYYLILILMNLLSDTDEYEFQSRNFSSTWLKRWSKSAKLATEVSATLRATASNSCNLGNRHRQLGFGFAMTTVVDGSQIQWTGLCVQLLHVVAE